MFGGQIGRVNLDQQTMQPALRQGAGIAIIVIFAMFLAGCGGSSPQAIVAHKIADALPRLIGPAAHYEVQVNGDPFALSRGRARSVQITGQDAQFGPAITVDTLAVDAQDVSFDPSAKRL